MIKAPCKDCPDRGNFCWNGCDKYKAFRESVKQIREAAIPHPADTYTAEQIQRKRRIK